MFVLSYSLQQKSQASRYRINPSVYQQISGQGERGAHMQRISLSLKREDDLVVHDMVDGPGGHSVK